MMARTGFARFDGLIARGVIVAVACAGAFCPVVAQSPTARVTTSAPVRVDVWTTEQGLPSQAVSSIAQDRDGFIWLTAGGFVARLDDAGVEVERDTLTSAAVRLIRAQAGLGDTLWLLDESGAVSARVGSGTTLVLRQTLPGIDELVQGRDGTLLASVDGMLWRLGRGRTRDEPLGRSMTTGAQNTARMLVDARFGALVAGADGRLLTLEKLAAEPGSPAGPALDAAQLVSAPDDRVYAVQRAGSGLRLIDADGQTAGEWPFVAVRPRSSVSASYSVTVGLPIAVDQRGWLWVAERDGYHAYHPDAPSEVAFVPATVEPDLARAVVGISGCVWFADVAVRRVCHVPFRTIGARLRTADPFERGPQGTIAAWDSAGWLVAMNGAGDVTPLAPRSSAFRFARAYEHANGIRWWSLSPSVQTAAAPREANTMRILPHRGVRRFASVPGGSGVAWYAVADSLYRVLLPVQGRAVVSETRDAGGLVTDIAVDSAGSVWVTVRNRDLKGELLVITNGVAKRLGTATGLPDAAFRVVRPDQAGGAWIGTYGGGLVHYRDGVVRRITTAHGLGEDVVTSLLDDGLGNLWMHGNRSVHRASWQSLTAFVNQQTSRIDGVAYGRRDGLVTPETIGSSGVTGAPGQLWFPTIEGATLLNVAAALAADSVAPRVSIVGLVAEGFGAQSLRDRVVLPRGARRVSARFAALGVPRVHAVRFAYRIDALDDDWIDAQNTRQAIYSALPPGVHTLRVRATSASGVLGDEDAVLTMEIPAYFYETPLFLALVLLGTAALAVAALRTRERRLTLRSAALEQAVHERTTHLQSALETVETQAEQLRAIDETRSRILANVSHEFRTPLSLILGPVDELLTTPVVRANAVAAQRLGVVSRNAKRLHALVEQLLDAARLEAGTMPVSFEVHDIVPLLRRLADSYASLAERRRITFRLSCPVGALRVRCDPDHIEKIVGNLVGNALKFTPEGGAVELRALRDNREGVRTVRLEVSDNGRGIAPAFHEAIFERFRQVDDSMRRAEGGTGIGLALVRELVELYGGTVSVQSDVGAGSTFVVRLPADSSDTAQLASGVPETTAQTTAPLNTPPDSPPLAPAETATGDTALPTLLLVEDNEELREWLREQLATRYRVSEAGNGAEALEMARNEPPDIIVSDVMMPIMDGLELCSAIRADPLLDAIPVVLLTARASRESRMSGLRDGADDYVAKPVDVTELSVRIDNLVASRERVKQRYAAVSHLPAISVPLAQPPRDSEEQRLLDSLSSVFARHLDDEHLTTDVLARSLGLSRSAMYRRLQVLLGRSPLEAMWEYRLLQAAQWLTATEISVSEIAYSVGFKTVPHFSSRFRERFGLTPTQYRTAGEKPDQPMQTIRNKT